jgi:hypothetical protein
VEGEQKYGVDVRIHGHTTDTGPPAQPTCSPSFPQIPILPQGIADPADRRATILQDLADLTTLQAHMSIPAVVSHHLCRRASRANENRGTGWDKGDVVNNGADGDEPETKDIPGLESFRPQETESKRLRRGMLQFLL